ASYLTSLSYSVLFFFNPPSPSNISTLSLHDALPIYPGCVVIECNITDRRVARTPCVAKKRTSTDGNVCVAGCVVNQRIVTEKCRSEEHTSELQSLTNLVCRLLLEKKKKT